MLSMSGCSCGSVRDTAVAPAVVDDFVAAKATAKNIQSPSPGTFCTVKELCVGGSSLVLAMKKLGTIHVPSVSN